MLKIVMDTNTLISAIGWKGKERKLLDNCIQDKIQLIESPLLLEELIKVLKKSKFDFIPIKKKAALIKYLIETSEIVHPKEKLNIIKEDPTDNRILECALAGKVDYVISGDEHLLKLKRFRNIKIINASRFLEISRI